MEPLVSILIPTCSRTELAVKAIRSAMSQTYKNLEIIVSDNSDDDALKFRIEELATNKVKYYKNSQNIGPILNWRQALHSASGKYCLILPDDDYLLNPYYVEDAVNILEGGRVSLVIPECICFYPNKNNGLASTRHKGLITGSQFFQNELHIPHIGNVFIREQAIEFDAFSSNEILWSDIELWWRILECSNVYCYNTPSILYLFHGDNIVTNMTKTQLILNSKFVARDVTQKAKQFSVPEKLLRYLKMVDAITGAVDRAFVIEAARLNGVSDQTLLIYGAFMMYSARRMIKSLLTRLIPTVLKT